MSDLLAIEVRLLPTQSLQLQPSPRIVARAIGWVPEIPLASMVKGSINFNFTVHQTGSASVMQMEPLKTQELRPKY